jgi:hypothetical protein
MGDQRKFKIQMIKINFKHFVIGHSFDVWILTFDLFQRLASCNRREDAYHITIL